MPKPNPDHIEAILAIINDCPFFRHMSMKVMEIGVGYSVVCAEIRKNHMNPFGGLHGGVYASVIDTAAFWSAYCDLPEEKGLISIDLKVDFLAPIAAKKIIIKGARIKAGKTLYLTEAKICDENDKVLAHGTSKLMVIHNRQSVNDVIEYVGSTRLPEKFIPNG